MSRFTLVIMAIVCMLSACSFSDDNDPVDQAPANSAEEIGEQAPMVPAIIFVQYLNQQAPEILCEQDAGVACLGMPNVLCVSAVQASAERCGPKLLEKWPASFPENQQSAQTYSQDYRQCILADWITEFGLEQERLLSCGLKISPENQP